MCAETEGKFDERLKPYSSPCGYVHVCEVLYELWLKVIKLSKEEQV